MSRGVLFQSLPTRTLASAVSACLALVSFRILQPLSFILHILRARYSLFLHHPLRLLRGAAHRFLVIHAAAPLPGSVPSGEFDSHSFLLSRYRDFLPLSKATREVPPSQNPTVDQLYLFTMARVSTVGSSSHRCSDISSPRATLAALSQTACPSPLVSVAELTRAIDVGLSISLMRSILRYATCQSVNGINIHSPVQSRPLRYTRPDCIC